MIYSNSRLIRKVQKDIDNLAKDRVSDFIGERMKDFSEGRMKSSSGEVVTDKDQALAIAHSEARAKRSLAAMAIRLEQQPKDIDNLAKDV